MKKVCLTIVNPVDKSIVSSSELYESSDNLLIEKALGKFGISKSEIKGSSISNTGLESPLTGEYQIFSGIVSGTSKLVMIIICNW
jgi:hypothetical protein